MPRVSHPMFPLPLILLVLLALLLGQPAVALAGDCSTCPAPTGAQLASAGMNLQYRSGEYGLGTRKDYVELDAGECTGTLVDPPQISRDSSYLVLRGAGEVWDCPHSKSVDTVTVTVSETDSSSWTLTTKVGAKLKTLVAEVTAEISAGNTTGESITEVTSISKQIIPGWCHRIQWEGWFEVSTYNATAELQFTQRWAWWTKNENTGYAVHQKGDIYVDCGSSVIELTRKAPIAGYFKLSQSGCGLDCGPIPTMDLGYFPELPLRLQPAPDPVEPDPQAQSSDNPAPAVVPCDPPGSGCGGDDVPLSSGDLPYPPGTEDDPPTGTSTSPLQGDDR